MSDKPNIWQLQAQSDIQGLTTALEHGDAGVRKRAAAALRTLGAASAVPILRNVLEQESDPDARAHLLAALDHLTSEQAFDDTQDASQPVLEQNRISRLVAELNHSDPKRTIAATRELAMLNDKLAAEPLVMLFNNAEKPANVRLAAAEALLRLESAPVEASLLGALRSPKWEIRRKAAGVLGQIKAEWAILPLHRTIVNDQHEAVRKTARAALRHIGTPQALAALKAALQQASAGNSGSAPANSGKDPAPQDSPEQSQRRSALLSRMEKSLDAKQPPTEQAEENSAADPRDSGSKAAPENAEGGKLSWPKREPVKDVFLAPTAQLDPSILDEFARRLQQHSPIEELGHQAEQARSAADEEAEDGPPVETDAAENEDSASDEDRPSTDDLFS